MDILYSPHFERDYKKLPDLVKRKAERKETIFRADPFDKRLRTHKLRGALQDCWAFSIDRKYRIIFQFSNDDEQVWFLVVGDHAVYEQ